MPKQVRADETRVWINDYFSRRPDIGLAKAMANSVLNPRNPFAREERRRPKPGFLFAAGIFAGVIAWFLYFNFFR
jgi:hypothetical protein